MRFATRRRLNFSVLVIAAILVWAWVLIAKLMFFSGWVKLAWATPQHPEWWPDITAMTFHYMTQPITIDPSTQAVKNHSPQAGST